MYLAALLLHSWLRYAVLALGLALLFAAAAALRGDATASPGRERLHRAFVATLDLQLLLGLLLYFVWSPVSAAALSDLGSAMKDPTLRFFGVEHTLTMLVAIVVAHVGRARAKRKQGRAALRTIVRTQALWALLTLLAIPWPGLDIARPLLRGL